MRLCKRDNTVVDFDVNKISAAVMSASQEAGRSPEDSAILASRVVVKVLQFTKHIPEHRVSISEVQTVIENSLMQFDKDVARHFIQYRHDRDQARELTADLHKNIVGLVDATNKEVLTENANKDSTQFHTQRDLLAGIVSKHYALNYLLPKEVAKAHLEGLIHYHDLDYSPMFGYTNCCLVDISNMLRLGFRLGNAEIEPPKSIQTAANIVSQVAQGVASAQFGGISFNRLDEALAPYASLSFKKNLKKYSSLCEIALESVGDSLSKEGIKNLVEKFHLKAKEQTSKDIYDAMQTLELM